MTFPTRWGDRAALSAGSSQCNLLCRRQWRGAPAVLRLQCERQTSASVALKMWSQFRVESRLPGRQHAGLELLRRRQPGLHRRQLRGNRQHALLPHYRVRHLDAAPGRGQLPAGRGQKPCDPLTTFYICNRPVFVASAGASLSPNLAGRLAARLRRLLSTQPQTECRPCQPLSQKRRRGFRTANTTSLTLRLGRLRIVPHLSAYRRSL